MDDRRRLQSKPKVARNLMGFFSCDEAEGCSARPWTSDSDTSQSDGNHQSSPVAVPRRHNSHRGYCSDSSPCKQLRPIGVFWDIENCQIPKGRSAVAVAQAIRDKFFDGYREAEFLVVCDVKKETSQVIQELNDAQVNLIHVGSHCKNAADEKLRQSIRRFADIHGSLSVIVLISGDINFAPDLCDLRHRKKIHVILVHNDFCSESLILCANEHYRFSDLVCNLPYRGAFKSVHQAAEVTVSSLPMGMDSARVRMKLKRMSENCGGKVGNVVGELASIRFPSIEFAMRAQKRMDGEVVFGSKINVGNPNILRDQKAVAYKDFSPVKNNKRTNFRRDDDGYNFPQWMDQQDQSCSNGPPTPGFYGSSPHVKPIPFFNQENVPFPETSQSWKHLVPPRVKLPNQSAGRPILGRRNDPNYLDHNNGVGSGRHSLDSMLDFGEEPSGGKHFHPSSPSYVWPTSNNQGVRRCRTPSPSLHALLGLNTSIPPPPIVNLPRSHQNQLTTEHTFQPIPVKPFLPTEQADLLVTNLDQSVDVMEMRRRLSEAFGRYCSVLNLSVIVQSDGSLAASVRVSSQPGARTAIAHLQGYQIGGSQIHITLKPSGDANGHHKNGASHEQTPSPASSASGSGEISYCPRHGRQRSQHQSLPTITVGLDEFTKRLTGLVSNHDNRLPLASLADCYEAVFGPVLQDGRSVPMELLVSCVHQVETVPGQDRILQLSTTSTTAKHQDAQLPSNPSPSANSLLDKLAEELTELLKTRAGCQILFTRLTPAYRQHFVRHIKLADYGVARLMDLLRRLPNILVIGQGDDRVVTLTHHTQMQRFTSDLLRVLRSLSSKQLTLKELPALWERIIGRKLDPTEYGLCIVQDLLSRVAEDSVQLTGCGDETVIAVVPRSQTPGERQRTQKFASQVIELLSKHPQFSMDFTKFIPAYHHHFKVQCKLADYGFTKLIELLEAIPDVVKIEEDGEGSRQISLTMPQRLKVLASQMVTLVSPRYPPGMPLENVNSAYLWQHHNNIKPADYDCRNLADLLNKLPTVKVVTTAEGVTLVVPVNPKDDETLRLRVLRILWERSTGKMSLAEFEHMFQQYYQTSCSRVTLENQLSDLVKITPDGSVQLTALQLFARDVHQLLSAHEGRVLLAAFHSVYHRSLDREVTPGLYGYARVADLLQAIGHVVSVTGKGNKRVVTLNTQLADVGISAPKALTKPANHNKNGILPSVAVHQLPATSETTLNGIKTNEERELLNLLKVKAGQANGNSVTSTTATVSQINPTKEPGFTLLTPAEFLLPAVALPAVGLPFHTPPDPALLPKPILFNTAPVAADHDDADLSEHVTRKLRLAAHFYSPLQLK